MNIQYIERISYSVVVSAEEAPTAGTKFKDGKGRMWIQRGPASPAIALVNPPPPFPIWRLHVDGEHFAYHLESGDTLEPL